MISITPRLHLWANAVSILAIATALLGSVRVIGQQLDLATIRGTVTDSAGATMPGAAIVLTDVMGIKRTTVTNSDGGYEIPNLNNGAYMLTATAPGFKTFVAKDIALMTGQIRRIDIALQIGNLDSTITVSEGTAVIDTDTGTIASTLTAKTWESIPLAFYSYNPYSIMLPDAGTFHQGGTIGVTEVDGLSTNAQIATCEEGVCEPGNGISQSSDAFAVQEVKVFTSAAPASYSRPANIDLIYKAGSNDFHGLVYFDGQNSALNARDFFNNTGRKPLYKNDMYGVHASGPIRGLRRMYYYASWDEQRVPASTAEHLSQPTTLMQQGDFSQLLSLPTPITIKDPQTGQPFSGNIIPQGRINATSLKIQQTYILTPNVVTANPATLVNNYSYIFPHPSDLFLDDHLNLRLDYNLSPNNTLYGLVLVELVPYALPAGSGYPNLGWTRYRHHSIYVASYTHVFSPKLVNTFRWAWNKDHLHDGGEEDGFKPLKGGDLDTSLGLQGVNPLNLDVMGSPRFNFQNVSSIVAGSTGGIPQDDRNFDYADSMTWTKGPHTLQFGGEFRTYRDYSQFGGAATDIFGQYTFNGAFTGYDYADFMLGLPQSSSRSTPIMNRIQTTTETGVYIEDTYKVNSRLNIDYGIRWDHFGAPAFQDGLMYNWNPANGDIVVPPSKLQRVSPQYPTNITVVGGDVQVNPYKKNFRPRVAAAYRIGSNTVLRGSYGQFTIPFNLGSIDRWSFNQGGGPYQISQLYTNSVSNGTPLFQFPNAFASVISGSPAQSAVGYPIDIHNGVAHEFNVSIERQIGYDIGLRVSYVGNRNRSVGYNLNINKPVPSTTPFTASRNPFPQFVNASMLQENGATNFNSMEVEIHRKAGRFQFNGNWNWTSSLANYLNVQNPYSPLQWTNDGLAQRQRVAVTMSYELPFGRGRRYLSGTNGAVQEVLGAWNVYYTGFFNSGGYFSPSFAGSDPSHTNTVGGLPDQLCNGNLPSDKRSISHWFNAACYAVPASGNFGNARPFSLVGPGYAVSHLSLTKRFPLHGERLNLEYQFLVSNIFNHPNFLNPAATITSPSVGQVTSTVGYTDAEQGAYRRMEMKARISW